MRPAGRFDRDKPVHHDHAAFGRVGAEHHIVHIPTAPDLGGGEHLYFQGLLIEHFQIDVANRPGVHECRTIVFGHVQID